MMLWMLVGCAGLTVNDVTTGESDAYPELKALWVRTNPGRAFDRAEVVARSLPGWESCVVERPERRPVLHCEASSRTRLFTDDVWIWTEAAGKDDPVGEPGRQGGLRHQPPAHPVLPERVPGLRRERAVERSSCVS